jgi:hypothetical protein
MKRVFIAGHGRMQPGGVGQNMRVVPAGVTIYWAVPKKYNGTVGLSTAFLSGRYATWTETATAGAPYMEHYLCPDLAIIMATKGEALKEGPWTPTSDHYLLQPRKKFTVSLSSILLYLKRKLAGELSVYWTCCRSPVGQPTYRTRQFANGVITDVNGSGNEVQDPGELFSKTMFRSKDGRTWKQGDFRAMFVKSPVCFTDVDGGVTMLRLDDSSIDKQSAWPGVAEAEPAPTTRPRSGSVGSR